MKFFFNSLILKPLFFYNLDLLPYFNWNQDCAYRSEIIKILLKNKNYFRLYLLLDLKKNATSDLR